jgi:hypothetical protein
VLNKFSTFLGLVFFIVLVLLFFVINDSFYSGVFLDYFYNSFLTFIFFSLFYFINELFSFDIGFSIIFIFSCFFFIYHQLNLYKNIEFLTNNLKS